MRQTEKKIRPCSEAQRKKAASFFQSWDETLIWSCVQGIMGEVYADDPEDPEAVMAVIGDFCFLAGRPMEEMVRYIPEKTGRNFIIMVPENRAWEQIIEACCPDRAKKITRYAFRKEQNIWDRKLLRSYAENLPREYQLSIIDEPLYHYCKKTEWCRDFVSLYDTYQKYRDIGLGVMILKDGEPVAGASSYSSYKDGIEIEIDTREDYRRRGLAAVCASALILECIKKDWYPSWDAANLSSAALAEKLGYHFSHEYVAYEIYNHPHFLPY